MPPTIYGYARVSTVDQDPEMQILALRQAGCKPGNIYTDHGRSGTHVERPKLNQCLSRLQRGDMLVIWKLDRLGRNTRHLLQIVEDLQKCGVNFRCITQNLDTSTPMGTVIFTVFAAFAQYEHSQLLERTSEGRKLAQEKIKARDPSAKPFGRKTVMTKEKRAVASREMKKGANIDEIAAAIEVSRSTVYRMLREIHPSRFPRSKKKRVTPIQPEPEPQGGLHLSPEAEALLATDDPSALATVEKELGMTQWSLMYKLRYPGKSAKLIPGAAKKSSIRDLN